MYDAVLHHGSRADDAVLARIGVRPAEYILATIHRAANTDDEAALRTIVTALGQLGEPVVFPVHPRTRDAMRYAGIDLPGNVHAVEPLSYLEMLAAEKHARTIVTDSGGVQKEAYWLGVPCVTIRTETEWTELVETGWNTVAGVDVAKIVSAVRASRPDGARPELFGDGHAAERIAEALPRS